MAVEQEEMGIYEIKKQNLISAGRSVHNALTAEDRKLLLTFFGYENGYGLNRAVKSQENLGVYIKETLFTATDNDLSGNEEKKEIAGLEYGSIPTIFPVFGDWFKNGYDLSESEQTAIIRSFQSFSRFFITDYSFKRLAPGTRIFLCGPSTYYV